MSDAASRQRADQRHKLGAWGEHIAARHLEQAGYTILERGWRCSAGEIDIVATHSNTLVIVEVRTRRGTAHGSPEKSITASKQARLVTLTESYLAARRQADQPWSGAYRIDIIAITLDHRGALHSLNHVESAVGG